MQQFLGCSMKECLSEFGDKNDLLSSDKIKKMIGIVDTHQKITSILLSRILIKMKRNALTRFLSSGFECLNKPNAKRDHPPLPL